LTGTGQVAKAETAIPLVHQAQLRKLAYHAGRHLAQSSQLIGRIGFLDAVRDRPANPFEKATLTDGRDAVFAGAAELVRGTPIVQEGPAELADNEDFRSASFAEGRAMRSRWLKHIVFLLLITIKEPAMAENLTVSDETRSDVAALVAAQDAAWNRGSAEAFAARALPDIVFTNIFGMFSVGKAPFLAQHERIFSTIYKGTTNHQQIQHITLVKPDVAIVETFAVVTGAPQAPSGVQLIDGALHARPQQVLVRRADGWWIASFHNVAVNPAYASGPPPKL